MINNQLSKNGYTLIEILIVMVIVSIVTGVAMLTIGRSENKKLETVASELTQMISLAEEQAMLQPAVLGLAIAPQSYRFFRLKTDESTQKNSWVLLQDYILNRQMVPQDIELRLMSDGQKQSDQKPAIIISTNGDMTPFTIYISKRNEKPKYIVRGDTDGNVTSEALS